MYIRMYVLRTDNNTGNIPIPYWYYVRTTLLAATHTSHSWRSLTDIRGTSSTSMTMQSSRTTSFLSVCAGNTGEKYCELKVFDIYLLIQRIYACMAGSAEEKHGMYAHEIMPGSEEGKGDGVRSHRNHNRSRPRIARLYTVRYCKSRRLRGCK